MLRLLDLFSGIGGFSLAARWTGAIETVAFVEIDPFCQKVLRKHWPSVPIISDIREVTGERIREIIADTIDEGLLRRCGGSDRNGTRVQEGEQTGNITRGATARCDEESVADTESEQAHTAEQGGLHTEPGGTDSRIDILTGGFPCQPFSCAGKREGTADNRFLWPEMLRVIREVHPTWVVAENVSGLLTIGDGMVFEDCCSQMESEGYEVQPFVIPACAVNAPHRRDRVWIVGRKVADDTKGRGCGLLHTENIGEASGKVNAFTDADRHAPDTCNEGLQRGERAGAYDEGQTAYGPVTERNSTWHEPWLEVATRLCRVDDGLPRGVDRVNRLKALGNAIVPQVAYQILRAICKVTSQPTGITG